MKDSQYRQLLMILALIVGIVLFLWLLNGCSSGGFFFFGGTGGGFRGGGPGFGK